MNLRKQEERGTSIFHAELIVWAVRLPNSLSLSLSLQCWPRTRRQKSIGIFLSREERSLSLSPPPSPPQHQVLWSRGNFGHINFLRAYYAHLSVPDVSVSSQSLYCPSPPWVDDEFSCGISLSSPQSEHKLHQSSGQTVFAPRTRWSGLPPLQMSFWCFSSCSVRRLWTKVCVRRHLEHLLVHSRSEKKSQWE